MQKIQWHLFSSDDYTLAVIDMIAHNCKSLIIALALMEKEITVEQAFEAALTEELYQQGLEGEVEGAHDVEKSHLKFNLSSAALFHYLIQLEKLKTN
jgi:ATP synthase F1 complex assembly factor 2